MTGPRDPRDVPASLRHCARGQEVRLLALALTTSAVLLGCRSPQPDTGSGDAESAEAALTEGADGDGPYYFDVGKNLEPYGDPSDGCDDGEEVVMLAEAAVCGLPCADDDVCPDAPGRVHYASAEPACVPTSEGDRCVLLCDPTDEFMYCPDWGDCVEVGGGTAWCALPN